MAVTTKLRKKVTDEQKLLEKESTEKQTCRKCRTYKKLTDFPVSYDKTLDTSGRSSICRQCSYTFFAGFLASEGGFERAMLKYCKLMNLRYDFNAIESAKEQSKKKEKTKGVESTSDDFLQLYMRALQSIHSNLNFQNADFTFIPVAVKDVVDDDELDELNAETKRELVLRWGENLTYTDYMYLEQEYADLCKTHESDARSKQILLQEICYARLNIRKGRLAGENVDGMIKQLQDLLKTAAIDPGKMTAASSGKGLETFGEFVRIIENEEPAEYYKDKQLFKDYDNIGTYFYKYVTRPIKNFVTGSRDFSLDGSEDEFEDGDLGESMDAIIKEIE